MSNNASSSSRIRVKWINGGLNETLSYSCAQDVKNFKGKVSEYSYCTDTYETTPDKWLKWVEFLLGVGLPIKYSEASNIVTLTDINYIVSGRHFLWLHALIRMVDERESGFKRYVKYVYELRDTERLADLSNYQILQLALFFENTLTEADNVYTHCPFPTIQNDSRIPSKLITHNEAVTRYEVFSSILPMAQCSSRTIRTESVTTWPNPSGRSIQSKLNLESGTIGIFRAKLNSNLNKIFSFLEVIAKDVKSELAVCTKIGKHDTLIKGNVYYVNQSATSKNLKLITVTDPWSKSIRSRHFQLIN